MLVVEALVMLASVEKRVFTVPTVVEEVLKTDWPETVSSVTEVVARVEVPATFRLPERVRAVAEAVARVV